MRFYAYTHAHRCRQHLPSVSRSSHWTGLCLLKQHCLTKTVSLYFWLSHRVILGCWIGPSPPLSLFSLCFACLKPSVCPSQQPKPVPSLQDRHKTSTSFRGKKKTHLVTPWAFFMERDSGPSWFVFHFGYKTQAVGEPRGCVAPLGDTLQGDRLWH